jgi:glyoxylase-like metal-dependent hydrolase (beta-lactamase superfamily II)
VAEEPFGRLERIGEGLYALISTPLGGDYSTVSNGGIIVGGEGTLVVEAFQTAEGAEWLARQARELTGRWPSHVLVTHYHGDHTRGVEGYADPGLRGEPRDTEGVAGGDPGLRSPSPPKLLATATTRSLTVESLPNDAPQPLRRLWADVVLLPPEEGEDLDLGGRLVRFVPRHGHTSSDVCVEVPAVGLVWCGDLVWNGMFPNYMDAIPSALSTAVRRLRLGEWTAWVPGHGPMAGPGDMDRYMAVIDGIEETARRASREGWTSEEAGERHTIPPDLGEWTLFNPSYFQRAIEAWLKELG